MPRASRRRQTAAVPLAQRDHRAPARASMSRPSGLADFGRPDGYVTAPDPALVGTIRPVAHGRDRRDGPADGLASRRQRRPRRKLDRSRRFPPRQLHRRPRRAADRGRPRLGTVDHRRSDRRLHLPHHAVVHAGERRTAAAWARWPVAKRNVPGLPRLDDYVAEYCRRRGTSDACPISTSIWPTISSDSPPSSRALPGGCATAPRSTPMPPCWRARCGRWRSGPGNSRRRRVLEP